MSYLIVPPASHRTSTSTSNLSTNSPASKTTGAPSAPGIHDTLRSNLPVAPSQNNTPTSTHPLEARLAAWQSTQDEFKMSSLRRNFGLGEPVRRGMELKIAREGEWRPMALGASAGVSGDILVGRDNEITWEDVYTGSESSEGADFHAEVERKLGMDW